MALFKKPAASAIVSLGPVPAEFDDRMTALAECLRPITNPAALGRPFLPETGYNEAVAAIRHYLPGAEQRRETAKMLAGMINSLFITNTLDLDGFDDVLGVTEARFREFGVKRSRWMLGLELANTGKELATAFHIGSEERLARWRRDDNYVVDSLAANFVAMERFTAARSR